MEFPTELGPKMQALDERERQFVWAFLQQGCRDASDAARKAGYSDPGPHSSAIRVQAHELRHRRRVVEAMQEVARTHFGGLLLPAVLAAEDMIANPKHPDHAKMVLAALAAQGLGAIQKIDVHQTTTDQTSAAILKQIEALATRLGVPVGRLLSAPAVVDAEFSEVRDG
jgi:hypothetical protein